MNAHFKKIHSLSMGGAHSQVEASSLTPPLPLMSLNNSRLCSRPHTTTLQLGWILLHATNDISYILVKAQPSTRSTWPWSPTRLRHTAMRPWPTQKNTVLATVAFLLLLDTSLEPLRTTHRTLKNSFFSSITCTPI